MQADGSSEDLDGDGEMEGVFVYDNGVARLLPVKTGVTGEDYIQITGGLQEGQQVISGPFEVLRELDEGEAVRPE
jgi:HlyD family secretion protein